MAPQLIHLPNGLNLTVSPVFGGLLFKINDISNTNSPFPPGWTIVLHSEASDDEAESLDYAANADESDAIIPRRRVIHRFKKPSLHNDHLYISSISNPNNADWKPAASVSRQIAMMLWATLWWYFHQPAPTTQLDNKVSHKTPDEGKPKGEWRIHINREGIFKGKVILPKLERMGLIASEDSAVGADLDDRSGEGWLNMFVSRRSFWQLDPRLYLFTLPHILNSPYPAGSPFSSRPSSPSGEGKRDANDTQHSQGLWSPTAPGPYNSSSHLPTYYPPAPPQYVYTNHTRHPIRPKPPRQGETLYTRFIPSLGQYLSFRVASLSSRAPPYRGPLSTLATPRNSQLIVQGTPASPPLSSSHSPPPHGRSCDVDLLHNWMNNPRVDKFWGESGPREHQQSFLENGLKSRHSFPVIGLWDGKPFGYFEIYWVKEDNLGRHLGQVGDYDRGIHCLVGEEEFRGPHRVKVWLSALVHCCWLADNRTDVVMMEPRVDNHK